MTSGTITTTATHVTTMTTINATLMKGEGERPMKRMREMMMTIEKTMTTVMTMKTKEFVDDERTLKTMTTMAMNVKT
jgi:hypothetical protein